MVGKSRKRHQMRHLGVFYRLFRDQEVEGSNPFAPNTSLKFNNFMLLSLTRPTLRFGRESGKKGDDSAHGGGIRRFLSSSVEKTGTPIVSSQDFSERCESDRVFAHHSHERAIRNKPSLVLVCYWL